MDTMDIKIDINVCRVCMKSGGGVSLFDDQNLLAKFQYSTQLKPEDDDGLPSKVCPKCVGRLKISHDFKRQSELSDRHLRSFISHVNSQFNQTIPDLEGGEVDDELEMLLEAGFQPHIVDNQSVKKEIDTDAEIENADEVHLHKDSLDLESGDNEGIEVEFLDGTDAQLMLVQEEDEISEPQEVEFIDIKRDTDEENEYDDPGESRSYIEDDKEGSETSQTLIEKSPSTVRSDATQSTTRAIHVCTKCNKDFSSKTNLVRHMATHDGIRRYQCNICGNSFTQNGSLKQHMLIHTGEKPYKCNVCQRGFTQGKSLQFHMRRHTGEKPFTCESCGMAFRQRDGLKRHISVKHSDVEQKLFVCDICKKYLHSKYSLSLHMRRHMGYESPNKCEECDKTFSSKASLMNHLRQHTGEKPFKCNVCDKEFFKKGSLISHEKQHLDIKPFRCSLCSREFTQKHQLIAHMNTHENIPVKKYRCTKCYKNFSIKRNLLLHLKNHDQEGLVTYNCDECNIGFNTTRGLKLHRTNQHKESVGDLNECELCNTPFLTVHDLNNHILNEHDQIDQKCVYCGLQFDSKKIFDEHLMDHELNGIE